MSAEANPPAAKPKQLPVKAADSPSFLVSSAPHLADGATTHRIMIEVCLAMVPLLIASVIMFGISAIVLVVATVAGCFVAEGFANLMRGRSTKTLCDGSALVTGMILAFSLPPVREGGLYSYMAFVGGAVAILLAKSVFGGLGKNLFNPAMVGRAFLMVCFPAAMGVWTVPMTGDRVGDPAIDGVTMATPLGVATEITAADKARAKAEKAIADNKSPALVAAATADKESALQKREDAKAQLPSISNLFLGKVSGSLGETSVLAALIGGLFLVIRRVADWRQPTALLLTVIVISSLAYMIAPDRFQSPLYHLTSGALIFGAFFIATDYVGAPVNPTGRLIFGAGVGLLIMIIRLFGAYPEGLMFAILIMNSLTPIIERMTTPTPFGGHVPAD